MDMPAWIQAGVAILVAVAPLVGWAFRLQMLNANLQGRVSALEQSRGEDLKAIREIASGQTAILVKLEGVLTELRLTRPASTRRKSAAS